MPTGGSRLLSGGGASLDGVFLQGVDLSGLDLRGVSFEGADLQGVQLSRAKLTACSLRGARLQRAVATGQRITFGNALLMDTNLEEADDDQVFESVLRAHRWRDAHWDPAVLARLEELASTIA